jgi:diacylglycerol O-acyltransferase
LSDREFDALFTTDKPVIFAYHGSLTGWPAGAPTTSRCTCGVSRSVGTTTTPFDMVKLNDLDRHCIADGIAATHVLAGLSDDGDADSYASQIRAVREGRPRGRQLPSPSLDPRDWVSGMWHASAAVTNVATRAAEGAIELAANPLRPAAASSLTGPVTNLRRYSAARVSLDDVKKVCSAFDVTLNDVALAAITDSYRGILLRRGEQPRRNSLRTLVPVSVRSANAFNQTGNQVSVMLPFLPVDQEDPVEQLRAVHRRLATAKTSGQRQAGSVLMSAANYIPFMVTAWTVRVLIRLP